MGPTRRGMTVRSPAVAVADVDPGASSARATAAGSPSVDDPPEDPATAPAAGLPRGAGIALAVPLLTGLVMAIARWGGQEPLGSDNDEYRLLADALWRGSIEIAGVEGTKYPVGYSFVLGLVDRLGLDMTLAAVAANLVLVGVLGALVWRLVPVRDGLVGSSVATTALVASAGLWGSVYVAMPDLAFVVVVTAVVARVGRLERERDVAVLVGLVVLACLLKSVGVLVGLVAVVPLAVDPRWRRWAWAPGVAALGLTAGQAAWSATAPAHTTGYTSTFWLENPFDASQGRIGALDLPARMVDRVDLVLGDLATAALGPQHDRWWAVALSVALVVVAVVAWPERRWFTVPFAVVYPTFLAAWPYDSERFGLVLAPWAAVGLGVVAGAIARRWRTAVAVACAAAVLVPHVLDGRAELERRGEVEEVRFSTYAAGIEQLGPWLDGAVPDGELVASPDYRELAYRTDRTYLPVGYTLDAEDLWRQTAGEGATWLVALRGLYPGRDLVVDRLVAARPDAVTEAVRLGPVVVYRIDPAAGGDPG